MHVSMIDLKQSNFAAALTRQPVGDASFEALLSRTPVAQGDYSTSAVLSTAAAQWGAGPMALLLWLEWVT
jgi:hypothetical protein